MIIGIVGKPNCGKSTFFKALTLSDILIANYPFATIQPNKGVAYVNIDCVDKEFGKQCNPRHGFCINHKRFIPVEVIDVAGLVPGAHEGKGMGNQFLDDLRQADVLIHVIDISGSTNEKGEPVDINSYDPQNDINFLEEELDYWYLGILKKGWEKFSRTIKVSGKKIEEALEKQLSGLGVKIEHVIKALEELKLNEDPTLWSEKELFLLARKLREYTKPIIIAANKIDVPGAEENYKRIKENNPNLIIIPVSAESELALKEANKAGIIKYIPGSNNFEILKENELNEKQKKALEFIKKNILEKYNSTGVQEVINKAVFELLKYIAVYPGGVNKLEDSEGNILPDVFLMPPESTALDFAYKLHTDFGNNFIKAIDVKTKLPIGKDHKLKHKDVIEIHYKK